MCPSPFLLHSHLCENCGAEYAHKAADGSWRDLHTCPVCKVGPHKPAIPIARAFPRGLPRESRNMRIKYRNDPVFLSGCCDYGGCGSCYGCSGSSGQCYYCSASGGCTYGGSCSGSQGMCYGGSPSGYQGGCTQPKCANSQTMQNNQSAGAAPSSFVEPAWMQSLTNFQTPYPYLAIGGIILVAALLTGSGSKGRYGSLPSPIVL